MRISRFVAGMCGGLLVLAVAAGAPVPKPDPKKEETGENKNKLVEKHRDKIVVTASTTYQGWGPEKLIDGNKETSWFSATGDTATQGKTPWVLVTFPEDVTVKRLTVLGNREPSYPTGYSVLTGLAEFLDADGKVLWKEERDGAGNAHDFDFQPKEAIAKVRAVRFTSVKDEGNVNGSQDIALGEIQID